MRTTVVHPGGIRTNIASAAIDSMSAQGATPSEALEKRRRTYNEKILKMDPAQAAGIIVDRVAAGGPRVLVAKDA